MNRNVTATILIVLALGVYFTVTKPQFDKARLVQVGNQEYITAIDSAQKLIAVRDQVIQDDNKITASDRLKLKKMLPSTVDNIRLLIDLKEVARAHSVTLKSLKASASGDKSAPTTRPISTPGGVSNSGTIISTPTLDTVTVSFSVSTGYQQFIQLLQALEANLRLMDLTHLTVAANDTGTYDFSVEFKTYWLRQQ